MDHYLCDEYNIIQALNFLTMINIIIINWYKFSTIILICSHQSIFSNKIQLIQAMTNGMFSYKFSYQLIMFI